MMSKVLASLLCGLLFVGCVTGVDSTHGFTFVEELQEDEFNALKAEIGIILSVGIRELVNHETVKVEDLHKVANVIETAVNDPVGDIAKLIIGDRLKDVVSDQTVADVLTLVEIEIKRHGGFNIVKLPDGTLAFSQRSKALLLTIVNSFRNA